MRKRRESSPSGSVIIFFIICFFIFPQTVSSFDVPERLEYYLTWLGIKAGESVLEISKEEDARVKIVSTTRSIDWVTFFYPVEDRVESRLAIEPSWFPIRYYLKQREGNRERYFEIMFDREKKKALYINHLEGQQKEYDIPETIFDPLSALFQVRKARLVVGTSIFVKLFDSEKVYDLEVKILKKERITVPAGTFDTILITPILQSEGIFSREGPIFTWLTDDDRRIPVMLKTKVAVGSVSSVLVKGTY